jgi:hypothetical protein
LAKLSPQTPVVVKNKNGWRLRGLGGVNHLTRQERMVALKSLKKLWLVYHADFLAVTQL